MIGHPATAAFWTSSNDRRPLTQRIESASGRRRSVNAQPTTLSSALCRPTSSRRQRSSPSASKRPVACRPPVAAKAACDSRRRSGSADDRRQRHGQRARDRLGLDRHRLQRSLPADAARRRRIEAALQAGRIEAGRVHFDGVCGQVVRESGACRLKPLRQAEAERQLLVVPRRPHRHRNRPPLDADLERLLDGEHVALQVALRQAQHLRRGRRIGRRRIRGHLRSLRPTSP